MAEGQDMLHVDLGVKNYRWAQYRSETRGRVGLCEDITTKTKNHFKHILAPLQKPIVTNYQYLTVLDSQRGMQRWANDGQPNMHIIHTKCIARVIYTFTYTGMCIHAMNWVTVESPPISRKTIRFHCLLGCQ